jgi:hypothetical protein
MANFYALAWFLLVSGVLVAAYHGNLTPTAILVYSLLALGLVFVLMAWAVVVNGRRMMTR